MMDQHNPVGCICNDGSDVFFEEYVDLSFPQFLDSKSEKTVGSTLTKGNSYLPALPRSDIFGKTNI